LRFCPFSLNPRAKATTWCCLQTSPPRPKPRAETEAEAAAFPKGSPGGAAHADSESSRYREENLALQHDLDTTRSHLQSIIQEQEATNQDLRAANERNSLQQ
jgi:hypothetical protein